MRCTQGEVRSTLVMDGAIKRTGPQRDAPNISEAIVENRHTTHKTWFEGHNTTFTEY